MLLDRGERVEGCGQAGSLLVQLNKFGELCRLPQALRLAESLRRCAGAVAWTENAKSPREPTTARCCSLADLCRVRGKWREQRREVLDAERVSVVSRGGPRLVVGLCHASCVRLQVAEVAPMPLPRPPCASEALNSTKNARTCLRRSGLDRPQTCSSSPPSTRSAHPMPRELVRWSGL